MSATLRLYVFLTAMGLFAILVVLYVAGCFTTKMSAAETAARLRRDEPTWKQVVCRRPTRDAGYWDYTCRVVPSGASPFAFDVKVNGSRIVDQSAP